MPTGTEGNAIFSEVEILANSEMGENNWTGRIAWGDNYHRVTESSRMITESWEHVDLQAHRLDILKALSFQFSCIFLQHVLFSHPFVIHDA